MSSRITDGFFLIYAKSVVIKLVEQIYYTLTECFENHILSLDSDLLTIRLFSFVTAIDAKDYVCLTLTNLITFFRITFFIPLKGVVNDR